MRPLPLLCALLCALAPRLLPAAVEVIAGAPKTEALSEPFSVDFDSAGTLYGVEFTKSNRVFKLKDGKVQFIAGLAHNAEKPAAGAEVHDGPDGAQALFNGMHDIRIDGHGRAILADAFFHRLRALNLKTLAVSTLAGTGVPGFSGDGGPAAQAKLNSPMTCSLSPDLQRCYIADIGNSRVRMVDLASGLISTVGGDGQKGNPTDGSEAFAAPLGDARAVIQTKDGALYVLLRGGNSMVEIKDGKVRTVVNTSGQKGYAGDGGPGRDALMNGPKYLAADRENRVLICDTENHCIRRYTPASGQIELIAGLPPKAGDTLGATLLETGLRRPHGVRIGPDGAIYIVDSYNNRVLRAEYK